MRWVWLAAGYAAAWVVACSTTTNNSVTNVTNVVADAGAEDAGESVAVENESDASASPDASPEAADSGADAAVDDADAAVCTELQGASSTSCRVGLACQSCSGAGFLYECAGGAKPNLPHCTNVDGGICCQAEWMRAPEDDGYCARPAFPKAFIGPTDMNGHPALSLSTDACDQNGTVGGTTYMMCCPDGHVP